MGVLFGLAMDYQVFLVSRMREDDVHDPDSKSPDRSVRRAAALRAVQSGFAGSAKVVTAAGLIMFAVFVAFVPEGDSSLKPIALGLAAGIAIDAFLVRMTLIPALMAILGERAWSLPAWLERILPSVDIEGEAVERERHLAGWPGDDSVVAADELELNEAGIRGLRLRVAPGASVVLTGASPGRLRALALAIAGRITPDGGRLRVAGHLLPGRAAWVRAHVGAVIATDAGVSGSELDDALRGRPAVVVIDGVDRMSTADRDQLAARLRDADAGTAVVLTASAPESARELLSAAGRPAPATADVTTPAALPAPDSASAPTTEVNA
jgi:RND superfamily putative drug exporter